ncbi:MAG: CDP-diacylglycerol--glycerol-3-phosphate 3-phosphatidyltransferase [Salinisphaeraceae bacterium]
MQLNLPTWLTLFRLVMIPMVVIVLCLSFPGRDYLAASGFAAALITDWFDGWLARRWDQASAFGAFLDPVADKLLVCALLVMLVLHDPRVVVAIPAVIIVGREITVSALREWMAELGKRQSVAVGSLGKYKTAIQMTAILVMLMDLSQPRGTLYVAGLALLGIAAALTVWSMVAYLRAAWPHLRD